MKTSETRVVRRSQITLNPYNPKRHTDAQVAQQKKNIKKNGYLGGVVWNEASGNLIDGHRRVQALDQINKYDGTPETDYEFKVEVVNYDGKTEKEQMTYMALGNSKADFNLVAEYIGDIDFENIGISAEDYEAIQMLADMGDIEEMPNLEADFVREPVYELPKEEQSIEEIMKKREEAPHMTKEQVKGEKAKCDNVATEHHDNVNLYAMVRFGSEEEKEAFCEIMGIEPSHNVVVSAADLLKNLDM